MSDTLAKLRSRGHWRAVIRPSDFAPERLQLGDLEPLIWSRQIQLRGWYYPHINQKTPITNGVDWIGQESESTIGSAYIEAWKFFTSGQFAWNRSFMGEWAPGNEMRSATSSFLLVHDLINVATETFEFAARLALTEAGGPSIYVRITGATMKGHTLTLGSPSAYSAHFLGQVPIDEVKREIIVDRAELIANPRAHALESSVWLLQRLGWRSASPSAARNIQEEVFGPVKDS